MASRNSNFAEPKWAVHANLLILCQPCQSIWTAQSLVQIYIRYVAFLLLFRTVSTMYGYFLVATTRPTLRDWPNERTRVPAGGKRAYVEAAGASRERLNLP